MDLAVLAGILSTGLFAMSYLPMLVKAARTRDLSSYSFGNLAITNVGNAVHSVYVFSLPLGPIWFLHTFYLVASALMLAWFLRYRTTGRRTDAATSPTSRLDAERVVPDERRQLTALRTSSVTFSSTADDQLRTAKPTDHMSPSSRLALSSKPRVA